MPYTAPTYTTPYHEQTSTLLLKELTAASTMNPHDTYYHRLWSIASGCAPNIDTFIDKLAKIINARMHQKEEYANHEEYVRFCNRIINENTHWIARCKQISDELSGEQ